jgi:signal transduction histidine kinase
LCLPLAAAGVHPAPAPAGGGAPATRLPLGLVNALVERAARSARALMYRISPPVLFDLGLTPALEWLADDMYRTYGLKVQLHECGSIPRLPLDDTVRAVLFRCVRELLTNVAKHAKVSAAEIAIFRDENTLSVSVSDGGVGFDPKLVGKPGVTERFGLVSVRERIGFVGGQLMIDALPGDGTVATLTVLLTRPGVTATADSPRARK